MVWTARIRFGFAAAVFLGVAQIAGAQIDHRADNRVPGSDGRVLDSSNRSGSGGINQPHVADYAGGFRADAIITGNVTGLAGFHAQTPVLQNNRFRADLPSAGLSRFNAVSVGVAEVRANRPLSPTLYYGRAETFADLGFIRSGLTQPGSSQLVTPFIMPPSLTSPTGSLPPPDYGSLSPAEALISSDSLIADMGMRQRGVSLPPASSFPGVPTVEPFAEAVGSSIFGTPGPSVIAPPPAFGLDPLTPALPGEAGRAEPWSERSVEDLLQVPSTLSGQADNQDLVSGESRLGVTNRPIWASPGAGMPDSVLGGTAPPELGGDRFSDLLLAVQAVERAGMDRLGFLGRGAVAGPGSGGAAGDAAIDEGQATRAGVSRPRLDRGVAELSSSLKWASEILDHPIESFAGKYGDRLNGYLLSAEEAMREGKYYKAAGHCELAMTVDPRNPLPMLGRGHALLAAGDYVSALRAIEGGIRLFPQIAAFRLSLPALAGRHDVFDIRRADLEDRLAQAEHYELRFLLGYMELYSGLEREGMRNLDRAAEAAPPDRVIAIFPDLIRGRRPLPPVGEAIRR